MRTIFDAFLDLLSRSTCAACDLPIRPENEPFCDGCGLLLDAAPEGHRAPERDAALYAYAGPLADAIVRAKYGADIARVASLARLFDDASLLYVDHVDCVVPVPLHPKRLRERGFNVPAIFAQRAARKLAAPVRYDLARVRSTSVQAGLGAADRRINVHGAFAARGAFVDQRVLLIDDVRTTGATLAAAREALCIAGACRVYTLALALADVK